MSPEFPETRIGQKVEHPELGEGVVIGFEPTGFYRVFFRSLGERQVPPKSLQEAESWVDRLIAGLKPVTPEAIERLWLAVEAVELPLIENSVTLTSAKVDLLPHQVVLVHRIANTRPRRFLIADEVGLGKTIETALILRELASRGEMLRALMVVPAGLLDNWRRELNEVFNLDFEVFGADGDVTDRKSNAFSKHNRLIASVDTLKRRTRVKKLLEAPPWDLVVFDEAHHLSVYKIGKKIRKTENFLLAESLRPHCQDLILLSATPHQGDNFRFWSLTRLLDPTLFEDEKDMVENRHRLNAVVIRRTKADACAADGGPLFARRIVHTQGFSLNEREMTFYQALLDYLRDGYNLATAKGNQGRALGFVMTVFQKIAASSFAAARITLRKRLLALTIEEAIEKDELLDVDGRDKAILDAKALIREIHNLPNDAFGQAQVERLLAEANLQLIKKRNDTAAFALTAESHDDTEIMAGASEDAVANLLSVAIPEERRIIRKLLDLFPEEIETKTSVLLDALRQLWRISPDEKVVIFVTYLGSIDSLRAAIETAFPEKRVEILKGGDHGSKVAAQRRFRRPDGPKVLLSTAAGREGINLQFSRVLFNYDLPWNPMDLEQRIGRIHRYGQKDTAQVYNLVAQDTIEGNIFLLLEEKLREIAQTLGKLDDNGQIAEDIRGQVLGQLSSRLSYDRLYQEAILDPTLKRTRQELEVAMTNANLARDVVFDLFQDLDRFNLGDYKSFDDDGLGMRRLLFFAQKAAHLNGEEFLPIGGDIFELSRPNSETVRFTTDRDQALEAEYLSLLGLEHPIVKQWLDSSASLQPRDRALIGHIDGQNDCTGLITIWLVVTHAKGGQTRQKVVRLGISEGGERLPYLERLSQDILRARPSQGGHFQDKERVGFLINSVAPELLHRELIYSGFLQDEASYSSRLLACLALS
ncbi:MAG: DEAD/DEAH box helicase [Deltaproteobacteria bacterium]|nr:DEAD/DEAH box helicase [Deltaproteobacteria bacterium]